MGCLLLLRGRIRGTERPSKLHTGRRLEWRAVHPLLRNVIIGVVGLIIAGALAALALLGRDADLSVLALLAAAILSALIGLFLYSQGWIWGSRMARRRQGGQSVLVAIGGGLMALVAAVALAGLLILVLLFYLG
jgi:MFS family permease